MVLQFQVSVAAPRVVGGVYAEFPVTVRVVSGGDTLWEVSLWKRYREFVDLRVQLLKETGQSEIPYEFPQKQYGVFAHSRSVSPEVLSERRRLLGSFLYELLNDNFDTQWRNTVAIARFLQFPQQQTWVQWSTGLVEGKSQTGDKESNDWIVQLRDCKNLLTSAKEMDNKDKLKHILQLRLDVKLLKADLESAKSNHVISEREYERRMNLLLVFQDDMNEVAQSDRTNSLNDTDNLTVSSTDPQIPSNNVRNSRRVFGETQETVDLNNRGLLQLNESHIQSQDDQLLSLHKTIQQQKALSLAMNQELQQQNEILTQFQNSVQHTQGKLSKAKKHTTKFTD